MEERKRQTEFLRLVMREADAWRHADESRDAIRRKTQYHRFLSETADHRYLLTEVDEWLFSTGESVFLDTTFPDRGGCGFGSKWARV